MSRPTTAQPHDSWNVYFAAASGAQHAERRRLHAAALAALLLHGLFFALRLPETVKPPIEITTPIRFPLEDFRLRPRQPEPPRVTPDPPATPVRATITVPGPPEPDLAPAEAFAPITIEPTLPPVEPLAFLPDAPPLPAPEKPVRYDSSIERPVKIYAPLPSYTPPARRLRREGRVILEAVIDEAGLVTDVQLLKGLGLGLDEAALETVATWRFEPARRGGRPIAVIYNLVINFRLD